MELTQIPGYHRLWSHKPYRLVPFPSLVLSLLVAAAVQDSTFWGETHCAHHHYTNTDNQYSANRGLFHSHIRWILLKRDREQAVQARSRRRVGDAPVIVTP